MRNKFSLVLAILVVCNVSTVNAQFTLASDNASFYGPWVNNSNEGFNFSGWTFGGNASTRSGIASSTNNGGSSSIDVSSKSFYLLDSDNSGNYIDVFRFLVSDLQIGQTFSIDMDVNYRGGFKGIRVRDSDDATSIFRFEIGNPGSGDDHIVYDALTGNGSVGNSYSNDTQFNLKLKQTSNSGGTWTISRSGGITDTDSGTYSGQVSSLQLYSTGAGSSAEQAIYFNNLNITTDTAHVNLTGSAGFRLLSTPVSTSYSNVLDEIWTQGATAGADATNGDPNVFSWDKSASGDANSNWDGVTDLTATLNAGEGFLVYVYADDDFNGSDDAFPKTLSVSGSENTVGTSLNLNSNSDGWTLVGNPFATTIDYDNLTLTDATSTIYAWDPNDGTGDGGTATNGGSGSWKTYNGASGDLTDGLITPFQGFFIQTASAPAGTPNVTFPLAAKSSGGTFLGKQMAPVPYIRFNVEGEGVRNSAFLQFGRDGSVAQKVHNDAVELQSLSTRFAQLGFMKSGEVFDIANIGVPESELTIPMDFNTNEGGMFTLEATDFNVSGDMDVLFHDYQEGVTTRVDEQFSYSFEIVKQKREAVAPLTALKAGVMKAKSSSNRFGITLRPTSVNNEVEDAPVNFALEQNYPNPFNPSTTITYSVQEAGAVNISVYNLMGQKVATLVDETKAAGSYNLRWNAAGSASGMYYYRLEAGGQSITRKMTLIK